MIKKLTGKIFPKKQSGKIISTPAKSAGVVEENKPTNKCPTCGTITSMSYCPVCGLTLFVVK